MITLGIDLGSNTIKSVALRDGATIIGSAVRKNGHDTKGITDECVRDVLAQAGVQMSDITMTIATGYGRVTCDLADQEISEISCHGRGAYFRNPATRTIVDIGGQDSKIISLSDNGKVLDFVMNDKCAAGTGRFLEVMAQALGVPLSDFGDVSARATGEVEISNTCTVFAESEVISLIARRESIENIIAGLHKSIANRVHSLASRLRYEEQIALTGGVAINSGIRRALETAFGKPVSPPESPQTIGALGAALFAFDRAR